MQETLIAWSPLSLSATFCPYPYHNNTYKVTGKGTVVHPDHGSRIDLWSAVLPFNPLVPISSHNSGFLLMTALFSQVERTVRSFSQTSMNSTSGHASGNSIWTYRSARPSVSLTSESLRPTLTTSVEQSLSGSSQSHTLGWNHMQIMVVRSHYQCCCHARQIAFSASWEGPCMEGS